MRRLLAALGLFLLGLAALAGLALSAAFVVVSTEAGRALLVPRLLAAVNGRIAGRLELDGFSVGSGGGLEIRGLRILDPRGQPVLELLRAEGQVDLSRLRSRRLSLRLAAEGLSVSLARQPGEPWNLEAALALREPGPPGPGEPLAWTIRLARLDLRHGTISVRDGAAPEVRLRDLQLAARALVSPRGGRGELSLRGAMALPAERPLSLELSATEAGGRVALHHLRAALGETLLDAVAEGTLAARTGRLAVLAAAVRPEEVGLFAGKAAPAPLTATGYGESDGKTASAALTLRPARGGGSGDVAVAARLPPAAPALGLDLRLDRLDPARVSPLLPPGELRLTAAGRATGSDLRALSAVLVLQGEPSRLRDGRFGPISLRARASRGSFELSRLEAVLPGATLAARGSWAPLGPVSGSVVADAPDLGLLSRNLGALTGERLPRLGGAGRIDGSLSGTAREPQGRLRLQAPRLEVEDAVASGAALEAEVSGPAEARQARLEATVTRLGAPGLEARNLTARARLSGQAAEGQLSVLLPEVGDEPLALRGAGSFSEDRARFTLAEAALAWPGARFDLAGPARLELAGPRVDRLELRSGPQRFWVAGGLDRGALDASAGAEALELARLPARLLPAGLGLSGTFSFSATARGKPAAPRLEARAELRGGAARGLTGVDASAEARVDLAARRAAGALTLRGLAGGQADLSADLPLDPRRAPSAEPLAASLRAEELDVAALLRAAGLPEELRGRLSGTLKAGGTVGAPELAASAALAGGAHAAYQPLAVQVAAVLRGGRAEATLAVDHGGARALDAESEVALDLAALLRDPGRAAAALPRAPMTLRAKVPGLALASLAGRGHLPEGLQGRLSAEASLRGSAAAPRGELGAEVTELAHGGFARLSGTALARAEEGATSLRLSASGSGQQLLAAEVRLGAAIERLADGAAQRAAPLSGTVQLAAADLAALKLPVELQGGGRIEARLAGTLGAPELQGTARADRLAVSGRPVGDLDASLRAAGGALTAGARLAAAPGGSVTAGLEVERGLDREALESGSWREAPARARLGAEALDLGVLASAAPGSFRSASGRLDAALAAEGALGRLRPTGKLTVAGGRANLVGVGEWHAVELAAALAPDAVELERLEAWRGRGNVQASGSVTGILGAEPARIEARLAARRLQLSRAGQDLATLDLAATLSGTATARSLTALLTIPEGTAVLPGRAPRELQSLEPRTDIVVGKPRPRAAAGPPQDFQAALRLLVPGRFKVKSLVPRIDLALRGDVTFSLEDQELTADGRMEAVEGTVEAYGRQFQLRRAAVVFAGGPPTDGAVDAEALWTENPAARVKIAVSGPVASPLVKMTSEPSLDEPTIALLIATGRTEAKAGTGGVSSLSGEEAGSAALGALATKALRDVLQDKLPVDVTPVGATQIRAGVYISDDIYIGYTRRLDANAEQGQNANEGRAEVRLGQRWTLETRYGDANTGSLSVVWSKDY